MRIKSSGPIQYPQIHQPQSSRFPRVQDSQNLYNMPDNHYTKSFLDHATKGHSHQTPLSQTQNQIR